MEEKNKLIRKLLSEKSIEDLQTLVNFKRQMKKPKSTVKPVWQIISTQRRAMKGYARAFKIHIINDRDPLVQLQKTRQEIGRFLKPLKVEMSGFKCSEALEVEFYKRIEGPKPQI